MNKCFDALQPVKSFDDVCVGQSNNPVVVHYGSKILIHGLPMVVQIRGDTLIAQHDLRDLTLADDVFGFAQWVRDNQVAWLTADMPEGLIRVYGTWAGEGILKDAAVTMLKERYFFIHYVQIDDTVVVSPDDIEPMIPDLDNVLVLPWDQLYDRPADFKNVEETALFGDVLEEQVSNVIEYDPIISGIFGEDGPGIGWLVLPTCAPGGDPLGDFGMHKECINKLSFTVT